MTYAITGSRLTHDGTPVECIMSRYTGGRFAEPPRIAVIHFTGGGTARSSAEWFRDPRNPGSSAHVVIDRDGSVIQCVDWDTIAWHAGASRWKGRTGLNRHSFGIELANWGYLKKSGQGWSCYTGTRITDPVIAVHRNGNPDDVEGPIGWESYPDRQFDAAVDVAQALVAAFGLTDIVGHDDIAPTRKWDPGPAFEMSRFRSRVFGGRASDGDTLLRVVSPNGLNLRRSPGTDRPAVELLPNGTLVEPLAASARWLQVTVLDANGVGRATGWVHGRYVEPL